MIKERLIQLWKHSTLSAKALEDATGIDRSNWYSLKQNRRRANEDDISAIVKLYPSYALWITTGNVAPEIGQTSPEYDEANNKLKPHGKASS